MSQKINNLKVQIKQASKPTITIGYYNLRGKAQVCRLLCQYLKVDYQDKIFALDEWNKFKKQKTKKWLYNDLPYLQEGDFTVTEPIPMCLYVIARFGDSQLLGRNLRDKAIVDMYLWTIQTMAALISINCQKLNPQQIKVLKEKQWRQHVEGKLKKYEFFAKENSYFLGYLTIIDFSIYELANYMQNIFPQKMQQFPKLLNIKKLILQLPSVKNYQQSQRCIKDWCPSKLLEQLKKKHKQQSSSQKIQITTKEQPTQ